MGPSGKVHQSLGNRCILIDERRAVALSGFIMRSTGEQYGKADVLIAREGDTCNMVAVDSIVRSCDTCIGSAKLIDALGLPDEQFDETAGLDSIGEQACL